VTFGKPGDSAVQGVDLDARGRLAAAYADGEVRLWNAGGTRYRRLIGGRKTLEMAVVFSPDGRRVLAVGQDGQARLWATDSGAPEAVVNVGTRVLTSAAFSQDGTRFATAGWDGAVRVWQTEGQSLLFTLRGQRSRVLDVGFGRTAAQVVSAGDDGTARIWDAGGLTTFTEPSPTDVVDVSPSGRWVATASRDGAVRLWDARTGALRRVAPGPAGFTWVRFARAADVLAITREATESVQRWRLSARVPETVVRLPRGSGRIIARLDPHALRLVYVAVGRRNLLVVRDLRTGREIHLRGAPVNTYDARLSPDGRALAATTESGYALVWRLNHPSAPYRRLRADHQNLDTVEFDPTGRRVLTSSADTTVRLWDVATGNRLATMRGHTAEVYNASFTPDGRRVISSGEDGTVRLWDARTGEPLAVLESADVPIYDLSVGRSGRVATLDGNDVVRVGRCLVCGSLGQVRALARSLHPRALSAGERARFLAEPG
jgi:WD40 repeat protein